MAQAVQHRRGPAIVVVLTLLTTFFLGASPSWAAGVDEVHYTFTGSTSVAINWRGAANDVRWGETTAYGQTATGHPPAWTPLSSPGPFWQAEIAGLTAGHDIPLLDRWRSGLDVSRAADRQLPL